MDIQAKKLFQSDTWAINGNRQDVETQSIDHPISRRTGFPIEYSEDAKINREIFNQMFCEITAACKELLYGISPWDSSITYPAGSFTNVNGEIYYADHGSTNINPLSAGQTTWRLAGGIEPATVPETIVSANVFIDSTHADRFRVYWEPPDDGGEDITQTRLRYSKQEDFSSGVTTITNYHQGDDITISSKDSDLYYIRLRTTNAIGYSTESASIQVRSSPLTPPAIAGFSAEVGKSTQRIDLSWNAVNPNNGLTISKYRVEWKSGTQSFSSTDTPARHKEITTLSTNITGLTNGTTYTLRVIPVSNRNTENTGTFTLTATPINSPRAPNKPTISGNSSANTILLSATNLPNNNGASITQYDWRYKVSTDSEWTDLTSTTSAVTSINSVATNTYHAQMRAVNNAGEGAWSDSITITVSAQTPSIGAPVYINNLISGQVTFFPDIDTIISNGSSVSDIGFQYDVRVKRTANGDWDDWEGYVGGVPSQYGIHEYSTNNIYYLSIETADPDAIANIWPPANRLESYIGVEIRARTRVQNSAGWSAWSDGTSYTLK